MNCLSEAKLSCNKEADLFLPPFVLREIDRNIERSHCQDGTKDNIVKTISAQVCMSQMSGL